MTFIFGGVFWSGVLVLMGICIILNVVFKTRVSFIRIFFGLLLCYIGLSLLFSHSWRGHVRHRFEAPERILVTGSSEKHDVVFGNGEIDLTGLKLEGRVIREEVSVVFGTGLVKLDPALPVRIDVSSAFAEARLPNGNDVGFGDEVYRSKGLDENQPHLLLKADVVFGRLEIIFDASAAPARDTAPSGKGAL
jgi:hypothetical protein